MGDSNAYPFLLHKLSSFCPSALQGLCQSETCWQLRSQFNCCHQLVPRQMNSFMIHIHCEHIKYPGVLTADKTITGSRAGRRVLLFPNDNFLRLITDFPLSIETVGGLLHESIHVKGLLFSTACCFTREAQPPNQNKGIKTNFDEAKRFCSNKICFYIAFDGYEAELWIQPTLQSTSKQFHCLFALQSLQSMRKLSSADRDLQNANPKLPWT